MHVRALIPFLDSKACETGCVPVDYGSTGRVPQYGIVAQVFIVACKPLNSLGRSRERAVGHARVDLQPNLSISLFQRGHVSAETPLAVVLEFMSVGPGEAYDVVLQT